MYIAGLDIGTTGCKVTIYDYEGKFSDRFYQNYPVMRTTGEHEVDALAIWKGVEKVIKEAALKYPEITGIGVTSFGESCVLLDRNDLPVRPVMLYTDPRGSVECENLTKKLGAEKIAKITGIKPHSMYSLPKILWVKEHQPEVFDKVTHILMMEDYIIYMLTGNAQIDYSLATRSMAFDIQTLHWSQEICEAAGIDESLFSKPVRSGTVAGNMKSYMAESFGFKIPPIILPVGHDQVAAAIGTGVFSSKYAVDGAGTVECITPIFDELPDIHVMTENNYAVVPYVIPGKYVTYAFSYTGGALIDWFVKNLAKGEQMLAKEQEKTVYSVLEEGMKDEPTGILVLPHFAGAATPYMDTGSKGAVVGLTVEHTVRDLYRAMMEGVVYEMNLNIQRLKGAGIYPEKLYASGGGAASSVWMQMKADILNIPIVSLGNAEAGATGCAMLAGIAVGCFENLKEAVEKMINEKAIYYPRKEKHEAYKSYYQKYEGLYNAVRPLV